MQLDGKVIIVTGGARGIGAGTVRCYTREGAVVAILDVKDSLGREIADKATAVGPGRASYLHCDITDRNAVFDAFESVARDLGRLDVLAHVAGVQTGWRLAEEIDDELWDHIMDVNARGTLHTNQAACRLMREHGYGKIINCASTAGVVGVPGVAAYSASKGAVVSWTRAVAQEWGRYGIRVNMVNPAIETPLRSEALARTDVEADSRLPKNWLGSDEGLRARLLVSGRTGLRGDADLDMGPTMVFLAGEGSDFITGQMFNVDGGLSMVR